MGPKTEYLLMARGLVESFPEIKVDLYALAYWLQGWAETDAVQP